MRPLDHAHENNGRALFRSYREFDKLEGSEEVVTRTLGWFISPEHQRKARHLERFSAPQTACTCKFSMSLASCLIHFSGPATRLRQGEPGCRCQESSSYGTPKDSAA